MHFSENTIANNGGSERMIFFGSWVPESKPSNTASTSSYSILICLFFGRTVFDWVPSCCLMTISLQNIFDCNFNFAWFHWRRVIKIFLVCRGYFDNLVFLVFVCIFFPGHIGLFVLSNIVSFNLSIGIWRSLMVPFWDIL